MENTQRVGLATNPRSEEILLIYTGGTIGGVVRDSDEAVDSDRTAKKFEEAARAKLPKWTHSIKWRVSCPFRKLSENMVPADWVKLAQSIDEGIRTGVRGIVIAHGTDTLTYSAAAISIMLQNPPIPIVFTGANEPLESDKTDAVQNLSHALFLASSCKYKGVFVSFAGAPNARSIIVLGTRARKDASRHDRNYFQPAFGEIAGEIVTPRFFGTPKLSMDSTVINAVFSQNESLYKPVIGVNSEAALFYAYPGFPKETLKLTVQAGIKGVVLAAYGSGTLCVDGDGDLSSIIREITSSKVPVFITSQNRAKISFKSYGSAVKLEMIGCIALGQMLPEVALVKLMWSLAHSKTYDETVLMMTTPVTGDC